MTTWDDLDSDEPWDDLGLSGDLSDAERDEPAEYVAEDQADVPAAENAADARETVRVTTDSDNRVVAISISNNWRNRMKVTELAEAIAQTVRDATPDLAIGEAPAAKFSLFEGRTSAGGSVLDHPMSQFEVNQLLEDTLQAFERQRELDESGDDVRPRTHDFTEAVGASDNEKVQVVLGPLMQPTRISLDEAWAKGARAERLIAALEQAFDRAYQKWRPPVVVAGEHDELLEDLSDLKKRTMRPVLIAGGWMSADEEL